MKLLLSDDQDLLDCFYNTKASHLEVAVAGERMLLCLYGDQTSSDLNTSRYRIFQKRLSVAKKFVHSQDTAAAKFHSYRIYLKVQQWRCLPYYDVVYPIMNDLFPAPQNILSMVKGRCKDGCRTMHCSCRKNGMECSPACSNCKGTDCENSFKEEIDEEKLLLESKQSSVI